MSKSEETTNRRFAEVKEEPTKKFDEQLDEALEQSVEQFYKDVLQKANETILSQNKQIKLLNENQIIFRDEVALQCYIPLIGIVSDYPTAARDAYTAADAFLRFRESSGELEQVFQLNKED